MKEEQMVRNQSSVCFIVCVFDSQNLFFHINTKKNKAGTILAVDPSVIFVCLDSLQEAQPPAPAS
jgi:hypothetical protein